ncbi:glycosyltransferase [Paenarthrobacter nitroguajacolicus]
METIMYISGGRWDDLPGTDRLLVESLAVAGPVLWVDQPAPVFRFGDVRKYMMKSLRGVPENLTPHLKRLRLPAPPLFSTGLGRPITHAIATYCMEKAIQFSGRPPAAVINASPVVAFPATVAGTRLLHLTDDWLAAADLIGFPSHYLRRSLERNLAAANIVTAVSPELAAKMSSFAGRPVGVLPNGCRPPTRRAADRRRRPITALVGQLNERLDLDVLESLADSELDILVLGPRTESNHSTSQRLDAFLSRRNVDWRGSVRPSEVRRLLDTASVGITPYASTEFNRSSFPLKTLEYLSAGLPVVATDLPSVRLLECSAMFVAGNRAEFVDLVKGALKNHPDQRQCDDMWRVAKANSWEMRAANIRDLCGQHTPQDAVAESAQGGHHDR